MIKTKSDIGLERVWKKRLKLRAEGDKLYAEGNKLWTGAILAAKGNITIEWINRNGHWDCKLETGEIFRYK